MTSLEISYEDWLRLNQIFKYGMTDLSDEYIYQIQLISPNNVIQIHPKNKEKLIKIFQDCKIEFVEVTL